MIIKKVIVSRLRALRDKTVALSPGLNIIKGSDNEAGKSSLRIAITKAMFQDPATTRKDIEALTSWGTDEPWEITLEFDADGDCYRLTKSLKNKTCVLACTGAHEFVARNKDAIAEKMAELTGCPSEVFFESTACIGQDELVRIIPADANSTERLEAVGTIAKRLQSRLSGTDGVNVPAVLAELYRETHHKDAGGPHCHLQRITERIAVLRGERQEKETKVNDILEKRRRLAQVRDELEALGQDLPAKQELLDKNRRLLELQKEIDRDRAQYAGLQRAQEHKAATDRLEAELKPFAPFVSAGDRIKEVEEGQGRLVELSRRTADLRNESGALQGQRPARWTLVAGLVLILGAPLALLTTPVVWLAAVGGVILAAYWGINWRVWQRQVNGMARKLRQLEGDCRAVEEETARLVAEFGCRDYEEFRRRLAEYTGKAEALRDASSKLDALVAGKAWQRFVEENADLSVQMSARLEKARGLQSFRLEPLPLQKLDDEVRVLARRQAELEQEKGLLEMFLQYTDAESDQLTGIEEQLQDLEQQRAFWERKRRVHDIAREVMEAAHQQTLAKAADLLEAEIGRYIDTVTEGRYSQVKVNQGDLSIQAFSKEKNDWVPADDLSRATRDQFYICARLALVKLITEGKRPPILLDDPFVNFHARRLRKMITLLQEIARDYQVLLFTCSDPYDYLGTVVSID